MTMHSVEIKNGTAVSIKHLKGRGAKAAALELKGGGTLFVCVLVFYNENDHQGQHRELYFHRPEYISAQSLPPRTGNFDISLYDYCTLNILAGNLLPGDQTLLKYKIPA